MLPDPKKVARVLKDTFFKTAEERQDEKELNRDVQMRLAKARLRRHIAQQHSMAQRLTDLARRALALNDETRFRQVGRQLLWTRQDIRRWEQYLLSMEILEARRDQARASVDLIQAIKAMSASLAEMAGPENLAEVQRELEQGLARAASLEERMKVMMEALDATLESQSPVKEDALEGLESDLLEEIRHQEAAAFDPEIEEGLRRIRLELERQGSE